MAPARIPQARFRTHTQKGYNMLPSPCRTKITVEVQPFQPPGQKCLKQSKKHCCSATVDLHIPYSDENIAGLSALSSPFSPLAMTDRLARGPQSCSGLCACKKPPLP